MKLPHIGRPCSVPKPCQIWTMFVRRPLCATVLFTLTLPLQYIFHIKLYISYWYLTTMIWKKLLWHEILRWFRGIFSHLSSMQLSALQRNWGLVASPIVRGKSGLLNRDNREHPYLLLSWHSWTWYAYSLETSLFESLNISREFWQRYTDCPYSPCHVALALLVFQYCEECS